MKIPTPFSMLAPLQQHKHFWIFIALLSSSCLVFALILLLPSGTPANERENRDGHDSDRRPTIVWTPRSVTEIIGQGQSKTIPVSFTASENLTNVSVRMGPELEPFVQTTPRRFAKIAKGEQVTLTLTISAAQDARPGTTTGAIHLQSGSGAPRVFARPLPVAASLSR